MLTYPARARTANDGTLTLAIHTGLPDEDVDVVVVLERATVAASADRWPEGFFETYFGALSDQNLRRPLQGDYEERLSLA